jgi:hypothetical protein
MTDDRDGDTPNRNGTQKPVEEDEAVAGNDVARDEAPPQGTGEAIDVDAAHDRSS